MRADLKDKMQRLGLRIFDPEAPARVDVTTSRDLFPVFVDVPPSGIHFDVPPEPKPAPLGFYCNPFDAPIHLGSMCAPDFTKATPPHGGPDHCR
jgi:hypothetical protein